MIANTIANANQSQLLEPGFRACDPLCVLMRFFLGDWLLLGELLFAVVFDVERTAFEWRRSFAFILSRLDLLIDSPQ
jgi:hypothetical protein